MALSLAVTDSRKMAGWRLKSEEPINSTQNWPNQYVQSTEYRVGNFKLFLRKCQYRTMWEKS
jgi:hypothetical protein